MSKAAISFFIRQVIRSAYETFPDSLANVFKVKAYDVHNVATSLLWNTNRRLSDVMEATCWKTPSAFANHYVWPVLCAQSDLFFLDLVIAARWVVS